MIAKYIELQKWVNTRTLRERILLIFLGWAILYIFWYFAITRPLVLRQKELENQIHSLTDHIQSIKSQAQAIIDIATKYSTQQQVQSQKALSSQSEFLQKSLINSVQKISIQKNDEEVIRDILNQPIKGVVLVGIKGVSSEPLIPPNVEKNDIPPILLHLYKHGIEIRFQSDFFGALTYLSTLENLSWHLYWDSLEYHVMDYPQASITVKFYILVNQPS